MSSRVLSKKAFSGFAAVALMMSVSAVSGLAQVEAPSQVSIQGTALVTKQSSEQMPANDVTKSGGLLVGYSYQFNRWLGAEGNYGFTRNTHNYTTLDGPSSLQANFHEVTGAFVAHFPINLRRVRPYALAGGGALVFDPTDKIILSGAERQTRPAFLYGGGTNIDITHSFGVRAEYRGLLYKVPDFSVGSLNLDKVTHLAQPSVGFFFRF